MLTSNSSTTQSSFQLSSLPTISRSSIMKVSTFFKGCILVAALLLISTEAFAQLPVRTRSLQLLGATSGAITQQASATTTSYTITWPAATWSITNGDTAILTGLISGGGASIDLVWENVTGGLIDGFGTGGQIAYFQDGNTIVSSPNLLINATTATVTIGATTVGGVIVMNSSGAGNGDVTISTNSTNAATFNYPSYGASSGPFNVVATTDLGTQGQIPVVQADGTVTWEDNPLLSAQRGLADPTDGGFSFGITVVGTPDMTNDLILVSSIDNGGGTGNILAVTGVALSTITVSAAGPFTLSERISWLWIPIP